MAIKRGETSTYQLKMHLKMHLNRVSRDNSLTRTEWQLSFALQSEKRIEK